MNDTFPDEAVIEAVNDIGPRKWSGTAYRHTRSQRDPLSGEGARLIGGRWNPAGRPTIYLAQPIATCVREFARMAEFTGADAGALIRRGWEIHEIEVAGLSVLDLTAADALEHVGLTPEDIADDDWLPCQAVGEAAHFLAFAGVIAPSATGSGFVIATFEDRARPGDLTLNRSQVLAQELLEEHRDTTS